MDKIKSIRGMHDLLGTQFLMQKEIIKSYRKKEIRINF